MRVEVLETYGGTCVYCSTPIDLEAQPGSTDEALELAHVIPHVDGGLFTLENLRPSHRGCNRRAGARMDAATANAHRREDR